MSKELNFFFKRHAELLKKYHFDQQLFLDSRNKIKEGIYSIENNRVKTSLKMPESDLFDSLKLFDKEKRERYYILGTESIKRGELSVFVLNGGMATRFGSVIKGLEEVIPGKCFLEIKLQNCLKVSKKFGCSIPFIIMNSFLSDNPTNEFLNRKKYFDLTKEQLICFNQSVSLRLQPDGELFITDDGDISPYTPGHGDFFKSLRREKLDIFLKEKGIKYLFFSNLDNLAAKIDPVILGYHIESNRQITAELAENNADIAGAPVFMDGKLQMIEGFRFPENFDNRQIKYLNTNNFLFNLSIFEKNRELKLYVAQKKIENRLAWQLEAITCELTSFFDSNYLVVEREGENSRFLPLKTKEDLYKCREDIIKYHS